MIRVEAEFIMVDRQDGDVAEWSHAIVSIAKPVCGDHGRVIGPI
jgi:hypothetical protein